MSCSAIRYNRCTRFERQDIYWTSNDRHDLVRVAGRSSVLTTLRLNNAKHLRQWPSNVRRPE